MKRRLMMFFVSFVLVLSMVTNVNAATLPKEGESFENTIVILHTNDSHGRMSKDDYNGQAGFTTVSAVKKAYEAAGATVLLFDVGDTFHGLPVATINRGADVVSVMNAVGYDAMTPGNHDFNYGTDRLKELSNMIKFPLLSVNVINKNTDTALFKGTAIIEKGGKRFGIFGISTPETAYKTSPKNVENVTFSDPTTYAAAAVKELKEQNVDYIVALSHLGVDASSEVTSDKIAAAVSGIDLMIDGHSHTAMVNGSPVDKSVKLVAHGNTLIASTGEYINNIGVVTLKEDGKMTADLIAYDKELPTDTAIDTLVTDIIAKQDAELSEVVGKTNVRLEGEREFVRKQETNLGNLCADAFLHATGADVAFTNGGGIRSSIEAGDITKKDLVTVFPFGNYVVTKKVTGQSILEAMEHGVKSYPELAGGFPQVSGITFKVDESKPEGERVTDVKIGGKALDKDASYLLATNDFVASGGDDYTMFSEFKIANEYGAMEEILIDYIKKSGAIDAKVEGRITVVNEADEQEETPVTEPVEETEDTEETTEEITEETPVIEESEKEEQKPATDKTVTYIVKNGDNLWKIAAKTTGSGTNWRKIYNLNKNKISNPDKIKIGQKIKIPA